MAFNQEVQKKLKLLTLYIHRRPKLTSREKANSRVVWLGVKLRKEPLKIWTRYKE